MSVKSPERKRLYLVDALALAYRSHFIFISRPLINSRGLNTSASYGFTSALLKLIEDHRIEHIAVVFDVMEEGGTFRDELYEDYKAHRDPPPDELLANLPLIKEVVDAFDIPVIEMGGVEADDVIGTLAVKASADGADVVIVSPDKDFQQLLSDRVSQFRPAYRGESFDPITKDSFAEKYGLRPEQFIDILALMGDTADNVPGIPGIGEKTAIKLIQEYGSVENLLEHAEDVKGKRAREGLLAKPDDAVLSKKLVTIHTDLDVELDWSRVHRANPDAARIRRVFRDLEFSTLASRTDRILGLGDTEGQVDLFGGGDQAATESEISEEAIYSCFHADDVDYRLVSTRRQLDELVSSLDKVDLLSIDTETTSKDEMMASLVGVSVAVIPGQAWYVPTPLPDGTETADVIESLRQVLESDALKIGQNIKYDFIVLARHGVRLGGPLYDTMVAHYLIAPEQPHNLDSLAKSYLSYEPIAIESLIGTGRSQKSMRDIPVKDVAPYACEDADIALQLYELTRAELQESSAIDIANQVEFPLVRVLADMEVEGIRLDVAALKDISMKMAKELEELEQNIYEVAGTSFNIGSPNQLGEILFDRLGLRVAAKTSTGKASTRESVLQELAAEHELPALILDWRELSKLKSTYVDALPQLVHPETGRVHTHYNQTVAATGRLSSQSPNLQNIPVRSARGREIRRAFVST
ncbi:MAG: DNA polymerase I, partial [Bacteroidetes bacterium]|nr:DNA polymerase I [Bacteroidota bacterium]